MPKFRIEKRCPDNYETDLSFCFQLFGGGFLWLTLTHFNCFWVVFLWLNDSSAASARAWYAPDVTVAEGCWLLSSKSSKVRPRWVWGGLWLLPLSPLLGLFARGIRSDFHFPHFSNTLATFCQKLNWQEVMFCAAFEYNRMIFRNCSRFANFENVRN